jgi:SprT protein
MAMSQNDLALLVGIPPDEVHDQVMKVIEYYLNEARDRWGTATEFVTPTVTYDLKGKTAGQARLKSNEIRINLGLLLAPETAEEMLKQTIPHEVAHLVHHKLYPHDREWHGYYWRRIMIAFGLSPDRCHDMPTKPARNTRKFHYFCKCGEVYTVGLVRHKRIQHQSASFYCKYCLMYLRQMVWEEAPSQV